jgi:N-acyl-D-amino-acid deacylase
MPRAPTSAPYDVVIRNGRVLDGQGNPWVFADLAIRQGRLTRIGVVEGRGRREIDASGAYVSPGWIDMMDQSGGVLLAEGLAENKLLQGVTTAIAGELGAPAPAAELADFFQRLEGSGVSLNFGTYYGTAQVRTAAMGDAAGRPTTAQLQRMKDLVAEAMKAGALGLAAALIYPPDSFLSTEELVELCRVAARAGGIYASHVRDEGEGLLEAIDEAIQIGRGAAIPVEVFHFKAAYAPGWGRLIAAAGERIEAARAGGLDIAANMYLYDAGATGLAATAPAWVFADGQTAGFERLRDPDVRARMKADLAAGSHAGWSNLVHAAGGWEGVVLTDPCHAAYDPHRGKSLGAIGRELGRDPADVAWDIVLAARPRRPMALFFMMSEADVETALKFPWVSLGSDAGGGAHSGFHPRAWGNFPRVIAEYVRARGVLRLEDAIRKMTSWPATRMGLFDRGAIREGLWADLTIFDYDRIRDRATYAQPSAPPEGIDYVLVNGEVVVERGRHTGARPGRVLRGPGDLAT